MTEATEATDLEPGCAVQRCTFAADAGVVCQRHRRRLEALLEPRGGLVRLYVELNQALRQPSRGSTDGVVVSMSRARRLPFAGEPKACQERAVELVTQAEDALRASEGWMARPSRGREGPTLQGSAEVVLAHLDAVLALEGGPDFADRLVRLGHRSEVALGRRGPRTGSVVAPCPTCRSFTLRRVVGTDHVACVVCEATVAPEVVDDWLEAA